MIAPMNNRHLPLRRGTARRTRGEEGGFTLVELMLATALGLIALSLVMVAMSTFVTDAYSGVAQGQANDKANLALTEIGRAVIASDVVFGTSTATTNSGVAAGFSVLLLTTEKGTTTCMQWRVISHKLEVRSWPNADPTGAKWVTQATGLYNTTVDIAPFALDATATFGSRLLGVDLVLRQSASSKANALKTTEIRSSFTALDAEFFGSNDTQFCSTFP